MSNLGQPDAGKTGTIVVVRSAISELARRAGATCPERRRWLGLLSAPIARSCEGIAAVEFAMIAPIMVALFIGTYDFGRVMNEHARVASAAGAGTQYAFHYVEDQDGWVQAARDDAQDTANQLAITTNEFCECPGNLPVACTATCGNPPETPAKYLSVQVVGSVDLMFGYGFTQNPLPITKQAVIRVE